MVRAVRDVIGGRQAGVAWLIGFAVAAGGVLVPAAARAADAEPTNFEQFELELLNRARANPTAEVTRLSGRTWGDDPNQVPGTAYPQPQTADLNEGLPAGTISSAAKQPLAFNTKLVSAARKYSQTLIDNNYFDHNFGGTSPQSRMEAEGYVFNPPPSGNGENLAATGGSGSQAITQAVAQQHHDNLFVDNNVTGRGHRTNMMSPNWREVGIGIAQGNSTIFGGNSIATAVSTVDFAFTNSNPFLTGVAYRDNVTADNFYTPGEGLGGVTISATSTGGGPAITTTTYGSGGYSLQLPAGTYNVTATGGFGVVSLGSVTIGGQNVKLDVINPVPEPGAACAAATAAGVGVLARRRRRGA